MHGAVELRRVGESGQGGGVGVTHAGALGDFLVDGPRRMGGGHRARQGRGQRIFALAFACAHGREDRVGVLVVQGFQLGRVEQRGHHKPRMIGAAGFGLAIHFMGAEGRYARHDLGIA